MTKRLLPYNMLWKALTDHITKYVSVVDMLIKLELFLNFLETHDSIVLKQLFPEKFNTLASEHLIS